VGEQFAACEPTSRSDPEPGPPSNAGQIDAVRDRQRALVSVATTRDRIIGVASYTRPRHTPATIPVVDVRIVTAQLTAEVLHIDTIHKLV
jgi:hypothetical protein